MLPPFQLRTPDLAAAAGIVIAAFLFLGLGDNRCNFHPIPIGIYRDESQMSGRDVLRHIREKVLNKYFYPYFHRGLKDTVNGRAENYQISDPDGDKKINVIHGCGDRVTSGVPVSRHGAGEINPVHQPAAKEGAQGVGIIRQHNLCHLRLRISHGTGDQRMFAHSFSWSLV